MTYLIIGIVSFLIASGQVLLKHALSAVTLTETKLVPMTLELIKAFFHPKPLLAIALCGIGTAIYFLSMRFIDISQLVPMTAGAIVVFAAFMGWAFFAEAMPAYKVAAIMMIVGGVLIVGRA